MSLKSWFKRILGLQKSHVNPVKNVDSAASNKTQANDKEKPKYLHPKIMLVDVDERAYQLLMEKGYSVSQASLGRPYKVTPEDRLHPVDREITLPQDYKEQEIVVIDLHYDLTQERSEPTPKQTRGVEDWWVSHKDGHVNPQLLSFWSIRRDFDRILSTEGVFVIFADRTKVQKFFRGSHSKYGDFRKTRETSASSWEFLSVTSLNRSFGIETDHGATINMSPDLPDRLSPVHRLSSYIEEATYSCTIYLNSHREEKWVPLAFNKFGVPVSGVFVDTDHGSGVVFVFPNIKDKAGFISQLIDECLPPVVPNLFPELDRDIWTGLAKYELASVTNLKQRIVKIREQAEAEIDDLEQTIQEQTAEAEILFDLARGTGDHLVEAVSEALTTVGFREIIDADKKLEEEQGGGTKKEDLQIHDHTPTLIVEVKGISNHPTDDDALAVQKYVLLRAREWSRVDIEGLSIINHQRHLPPLNRDNEMPFREDLLVAAEEQKIGLMTGWDLHRLVRSYLQNGWRHEHVRDLFYESGRIFPVPSHYQYIGKIERFMEVDETSVIGIKLQHTLERCDRIAYELPVLFQEEVCYSLQHNNEDIKEGRAGMLVGVQTRLDKTDAREGVRVFRVLQDDSLSKATNE